MAGFLQKIGNALNPTSIEDIKGLISKRNGLAKSNRFVVFMSPPGAGLLAGGAADLQGYIADAASGQFNVGQIFNDPRDITLLCESCSLPGITMNTVDYPLAGFRNTVKYATGYTNEDIQFTFHITNDYYIKKLFEKWSNSVINRRSYTVGYDEDYKTDVIIQQLNEINVPVYGVKLRGAFPLSIDAIELSNANTDQTQRLTVTMAYDEYTEEGALSTVLSSGKEIFNVAKNSFDRVSNFVNR